MSHFLLTVVLPGYIQESDLGPAIDAALQPFHEYESTGVKDQYVVWVDCDEEVRKGYDTPEERYRNLTTGKHIHPYNDACYTPATKQELDLLTENGYSADKYFGSSSVSIGAKHFNITKKGSLICIRRTPEELGCESVEVKGEEAYGNIRKYAKEHYGYEPDEHGRFGHWTNPNKKWDWFTVGGRYANRLLSKLGNHEDILRAKDIDFAGMRKERQANYLAEFAEAFGKFRQANPGLTEEMAYAEVLNWRKHDIAAQKAYETYATECAAFIQEATPIPFWELFKGSIIFDKKFQAIQEFYTWQDKDILDPREYVFTFAAYQTYALLLKDGQWVGRGDMGWWGISRNEAHKSSWDSSVSKFIESLDPEDWVVVVDCHI